MNDRYLYRAKRTDNGEWVGGNIIWNNDFCDNSKAIIIPTTRNNLFTRGGENGHLVSKDWCRVDPSTICRCTGLNDKNGKPIWENDIVCVKHTDGQEEYQENAKVSYTKRGFSPFSWEYYCDGCDVRCEILEVEVIGNIFDNPELLE